MLKKRIKSNTTLITRRYFSIPAFSRFNPAFLVPEGRRSTTSFHAFHFIHNHNQGIFMKKLLLLLLVTLAPLTANATLLGRVNTYVDQQAADKVNDAKVKYKNVLKAWEDATKAGAADIATKKDEADKARLELDAANLLASNNLAGPQSDRTGVITGVGPASISSTPGGGGTSIDFLAYQFNLVMPWKANCEKGKKTKIHMLDFVTTQESCPSGNDLGNYRFVPVYFLLHKTAHSKINSDTLSHDLLDNEHGGLVNIKFTPLIYDFAADDKDFTHGSKVAILDFGVKYVEAPSADPKGQNYVGAGYFGAGFSIELPMYYRQDTIQDIVAGAKPAGTLALGLGIYRNTVNSGGFDNSGFSAPVPRFYSTGVLNYEFQVTNVISIFGSRTVPTSHSSLGTYTSVAVKYNFK